MGLIFFSVLNYKKPRVWVIGLLIIVVVAFGIKQITDSEQYSYNAAIIDKGEYGYLQTFDLIADTRGVKFTFSNEGLYRFVVKLNATPQKIIEP